MSGGFNGNPPNGVLSFICSTVVSNTATSDDANVVSYGGGVDAEAIYPAGSVYFISTIVAGNDVPIGGGCGNYAC